MVRYRLVRDLGISGIQYSRWDEGIANLLSIVVLDPLSAGLP